MTSIPHLHLGCDEVQPPEWHNVDVNPRVDPDEVVNLEERWPWANDSVEQILAEHVVEHLGEPEHFFQEAARVLRRRGSLEVAVPIGVDARADPTHEHEWTWRTPEFFSTTGRNWSADVPLELVDRRLRMWPHTRLVPQRLLTRLVDENPLAACDLPMCSGELRAVYQR